MTYQETLDFLFSIERYGIKLGLERMTAYLDEIGNPHQKYPTIHIAGTNGKGSTAAMIQSILTAAGYRVGMLTSPHLVDFAERMRIGYRDCEASFIVRFVEQNRNLMNKIPVSFFEITTAMAFQYFAEKEIDIGVIEVGLGGRLDATNVITPVISIITNIDLEHTKTLGDTLEKIAFEKGGIIKRTIPCITASNDRAVRRILREICEKRKSNFIAVHNENQWLIKNLDLSGSSVEVFTRHRKYNNIFINLAGRHQLENALTALTAAEMLNDMGFNINERAVLAGLRNTRWKGRLQMLSRTPLVLADVAHNSSGIAAVRATLSELIPGRKIIVVIGILSDKEYERMLDDISRFADMIVLTRPVTDRAADPEDLAEVIEKKGSNYKVIPMVRDAYRYALAAADENDIVLVTGSHYTVGEVLSTSRKYRRIR
jgi:dihydrofolate synthase/folylpolyglutamate synthase